MSNQEQPTSSISDSNHPYYNPDWDGTSSRSGRVQADHYYPFPPPGFILVDPTDGKGPLKNESGIPTTHDEFEAEFLYDASLRVEGKILQAALDENGGQEIKICDEVCLEYSDGCLTAVKKIRPIA